MKHSTPVPSQIESSHRQPVTDAALERDRAPTTPTVERVDLTPDQIKRGESFGSLLRLMREERGLTHEDLTTRAFSHGSSFLSMLQNAERAAACCWGPWLRNKVWDALVAVKPATVEQSTAWHRFGLAVDGGAQS